MRHLHWIFETDAAKELAAALGTFGSLKATRGHWARVLEGIGGTVLPYLQSEAPANPQEAAKALVAYAVPKEGDPHPRRATVWEEEDDPGGDPAVIFTTPGGVDVLLTPECVSIGFGRDSSVAATNVASALWLATGSEQAKDLLRLAVTEEVPV